MREIKVPPVPVRAFDARRRPSDLLKRQVEQLEHAVHTRYGPAALTRPARTVKTEGQAAAFIQEATRLLHPEGAAAPPMAAAPPEAPATKRAARRKTTRTQRRSKGPRR